MATITFNVRDLAGAALPAGVTPEAILTPSAPIAHASGTVTPTKPVIYTPNSTGLVTATVDDFADVLDPRVHLKISLRWKNPEGYGSGQGYSQMDFPGWEIRVTGSGKLTDFIKPPTSHTLWWIDIVPPPEGYGYQWFVDLSTTPPTLKEFV